MIQSVFFSEIKKHLVEEKPFVIYKKPDELQLTAQLQIEATLQKENFNEDGFVFAPFTNNSHNTIWFPTQKARVIKSILKKEDLVLEGQVKEQEQAELEKNHISIIDKALRALNLKELKKVVLSRKESVAIKNQNPFVYFERMCYLYPNTFCYCWYHPKVGMWLGATPETLIKLSENNFETMALAGTMPFSNTIKATWGAKEKEEQQFVVDSILSTLHPITKKIKVGETITQRAGSLLHLKTPISAELTSTKGIYALIKLLHPTPAVCGLPKQKAQDFIIENEGYNRKYYTGFLGIINPEKSSHLYVNLRCMELEGNQAIIYIGGGITALSNPQKEWQETVNKSQIMKRIL